MKGFTLFFLAAFAYFQYQLWLSEDGWRARQDLNDLVREQKLRNHETEIANRILAVETENLADGVEALEEIARVRFNYIKDDEIFYITRE